MPRGNITVSTISGEAYELTDRNSPDILDPINSVKDHSFLNKVTPQDKGRMAEHWRQYGSGNITPGNDDQAFEQFRDSIHNGDTLVFLQSSELDAAAVNSQVGSSETSTNSQMTAGTESPRVQTTAPSKKRKCADTPEEERVVKKLKKHRAGNQQIKAGDRHWHLPEDKSIDDLPQSDDVGDRLQELTTAAAKKWNKNKNLSINEQEAIQEAIEEKEYWRANLLEKQAKGRWVENQVKKATESMQMNLKWSKRGVDVTDMNTGIKYDILSGTSSNIDLHAKRMSDELFRIITF